MALTQAVVDEFLAAPKLVERPREINWRQDGVDLLRWDALVETEGVVRGRIWLDFNRTLGRYAFNLQLHGTPVYGWHFRPSGRHRNPQQCGPSFPRNVGYPHEQFWVEGRGFRCAKPLTEVGGMSHKEHLRAFCERARIDLRPLYRPPIAGEQTMMHLEGDGT